MILRDFLEKSGRTIRVKYRGKQWRVDVDGLPGTEQAGDNLDDTITDTIATFVLTDWQPRKEHP